MDGEAQSEETPGAFLDALGDDLRRKEGVDRDLLDILRQHILIAAPAQHAVIHAKNAILKLASERAQPISAEPTNG